MTAWKTKPLGELFDVVGGGTPSKKKSSYYGGNIPWATIRDMHSGTLTKTEHTITEQGLQASSAKLIPAGEVIMASRVGLGKACLLDQDTAINQDIRALIPRNADAIDRRFCLYWLQTQVDAIIDAGSGATVQGIKLPFIKSLPFPDICVDEQKRIVAVLDQAFAALDRARANAEANLAGVTELERRLVQTNLTPTSSDSWQTCKLGKILTVLSGFAFKSNEYTDKGHFLIRIANVQEGEISLHRPKFVNLDNKTTKFELAEGDILTSLTGNIGRVAVIGEEHLPAALNQRVAKLVPTAGAVSREFLLQFLCSDLFGDPLREKGRGAAQQNVSPNEIKNIDISFPDKLEQRKIVESILSAQEACSQLRQHYDELIGDIEELRQSLLQKAFAGGLT
tara:strand:- start:618 stop:1802 length:1185 start_codon:yes stop_codon:yes gene_type:complete